MVEQRCVTVPFFHTSDGAKQPPLSGKPTGHHLHHRKWEEGGGLSLSESHTQTKTITIKHP